VGGSQNASYTFAPETVAEEEEEEEVYLPNN